VITDNSWLKITILSEVGASAFFALASAKPKKERESAKKKSAKKVTAPGAKEKSTN
jgi:hypothetical protein